MTDKKNILKIRVDNDKLELSAPKLEEYMNKILNSLSPELREQFHIVVVPNTIDLEILYNDDTQEDCVDSQKEPERNIFWVEGDKIDAEVLKILKSDLGRATGVPPYMLFCETQPAGEPDTNSDWVGSAVGLEDEELENEKDLCDFIEDNFKVICPYEGAVNLELYPHQFNAINEFEENQINLMVGSRQSGITTTGISYAVAKACTEAGSEIYLFNRYSFTRTAMRSYIMTCLESSGLTDRLMPCQYEKNRLTFKNGSTISFESLKSVRCSKFHGVRGNAIFIMDDVGYVNQNQELFNLITYRMQRGSKIILLTTGEPSYGSVFSAWCHSYTNRSSCIIKVPWSSIRRDKSFKKRWTTTLGKDNWQREYDFF